MTHAGGLSTQEATWHGIPMLAMPVFLDQFGVIENSSALQNQIKENVNRHFTEQPEIG